jgi:hypothetical protein
MANYATEPFKRMRDCWMFAKGLLPYVCEACFIQSKVASRASICNAQVWQPDLMNTRLEFAPEAYGVSTIVYECKISLLIAMPLAEMFLCRRNRQCQQQSQTDYAEGSHRVTE